MLVGDTKYKIVKEITEKQITDLKEIHKCTKAGGGCGGCKPILQEILEETLKSSGKEIKKVLCEHFDYSRAELYDLIKESKIKSFDDLIKKYGTGHGCETCKPTIASLMASIWNEAILSQNIIQDTNDKYLANIQKGGTYSVIPRIPGGEIIPEKLATIAGLAKKFDLYVKITGGKE